MLAKALDGGEGEVLRELRATARQGHTPVALLDGSGPGFHEALLSVAEQFAAPAPGGTGRLTFPRLTCGLLAVASGGWNGRDPGRIRSETQRILRLSDARARPPGSAGRWCGRLAARLMSSLPDSGPVVVEVLVEASLEAYSEGMSSPYRRLRRGAVWYRDHPNADGNPKLGLIHLSRHYGTPVSAAARAHAEHHLVRALLADVADAYSASSGVVPRAHRADRPLLLIDNARAPAARRLLQSVLHDRADQTD
ncbi:hypothetical protein SGFS_070000 [Streptomyces graminofaciens]|uniref:Uncharacterized protein n=2 Tax=Streptomyces graminofaciens TaxID=68212 RepID=A0ABM7FF93_9ACTN|nr:hypothetical protein SGFS_070000 [Streptomyces graminofaciens]